MRASFRYVFWPLMLAAPLLQPSGARASDLPEAPKITAGVVNIPVVEGWSARFTRVSTADGLSQSRVLGGHRLTHSVEPPATAEAT